jgi:tubulin-specific chaperone E
LRPNQPWDKPRTFLEALREKYVAAKVPSEQEAIQISRSKLAEEVGFPKFAARQAELRGIHNIVLDHMCIQHRPGDPANSEIEEICKEVTDVDVGSNLFESILDIYDLAARFPKLRSLTLDGNRFSSKAVTDIHQASGDRQLKGVRYLSISKTLLSPGEARMLVRTMFPGVQTLVACHNEWNDIAPASEKPFPASLHTVDLSGNQFDSLYAIRGILDGNVRIVSLKGCQISLVSKTASKLANDRLGICYKVEELDLRFNNMSDWTFFNDLATNFPNLKHLRTSGNPLYQNLVSADGKSLAAEDGYMLTIARLAGLQTLNYSKITDKERLNAETYYLNQIAIELSQATSEDEAAAIKKKHPRWKELCDEYGEPTVKKKVEKGEVDPNSLAARLISVQFQFKEKTWQQELPKTFTIYEVLGVVGKKLGVMPLKLRLLWESGERDPVGKDGGAALEGPEWWDSSDEEAVGGAGGVESDGMQVKEGEAWVEREVELVAGTRALGTYVEGSKARIRVEMR